MTVPNLDLIDQMETLTKLRRISPRNLVNVKQKDKYDNGGQWLMAGKLTVCKNYEYYSVHIQQFVFANAKILLICNTC